MISNFHIARGLIDNKSRLVDALSQFPVSALWLLYEYDQQSHHQPSEEDEAMSLSESSAVLTEIRQCYEQASHSSSSENAPHFNAKEQLVQALKKYPFSFFDLTRLVDVITYGYKSRNPAYKSCSSAPDTKNDAMMKCLNGLKRRANNNSSHFLDTVKSSLGELYDEQFLFLSNTEMQKIFPVIVTAEYQWLQSRERLTMANIRLVMFIANQYKGAFLEFDDLVQEGQTGLLKAVDRYNYRLGYKFSTYAGYWIRQAISRALSRCERVVRIPCGQMGTINKFFRIKEQLISKLGREPSLQELSESTGLTRAEIGVILTVSQTPIAIEESTDDDNSFSPIDFLEQRIFAHPYREIAQSELEQLINKAIKLLSPREARVICGHFGVHNDHEMTLKEIGNEMNLTRERVRQIQASALSKIKQFYGNQLATCL